MACILLAATVATIHLQLGRSCGIFEERRNGCKLEIHEAHTVSNHSSGNWFDFSLSGAPWTGLETILSKTRSHACTRPAAARWLIVKRPLCLIATHANLIRVCLQQTLNSFRCHEESPVLSKLIVDRLTSDPWTTIATDWNSTNNKTNRCPRWSGRCHRLVNGFPPWTFAWWFPLSNTPCFVTLNVLQLGVVPKYR